MVIASQWGNAVQQWGNKPLQRPQSMGLKFFRHFFRQTPQRPTIKLYRQIEQIHLLTQSKKV